MSTRPNGIYCHRNNYDVLGTSHDSLEVILYSDDEDDHRSFHPRQGAPPQQQGNGSVVRDIVRDPIFSDDEELGRGGDGGDDIFQMDDISNDLSASITSLGSTSTSNASDDSTSTAKLSAASPMTSYQREPFDSPSSPIQVRYYVPTNEAPQGLSQSVVTTTVDHNFIRRHLNYSQRLSRLQNASYVQDDSDDDLYVNNEEEIVNSIINSDDPSWYMVPFPSSWSVTGGRVPNIYSQSAPMISYLMDDMSFNSATTATAMSNTAASQPVSDSENQNDDNDDKHSIDSASTIETVRALSDEPELEGVEETTCLTQLSVPVTAEQDSLSLDDRAEKKEWFETDSICSVEPTVEEKEDDIASKLKDALTESINEEGDHQTKPSTNDPIEEVKVDHNNNDGESWTVLADQSYGPLPEFQLQRQLLCEEESRWERIHQQPELLEKLKHNEFVLDLLSKNSCPLKVSNIPYMTRYKCLQNHFFDPSVLYIRYIRYEGCAYVVYRNYEEMLKGYHALTLTVVEGAITECKPSTMQELEYDLNREEQRKLSFKNGHNMSTQRKTRFHPAKTTQQGSNPINNTSMTKYNHRDTFIPGHHNIVQIKRHNNKKRNNVLNYDPNFDYLSQTSFYNYNMVGFNPCYTPYDYSPSVPYYMTFPHPHQSNTAMVPSTSDNSFSPFRPRRNNNKKGRRPLPEKILQLPILSVQYIIMKPNSKQDYSLAGRIQYYPIAPKRCVDVLNYVFQISHQVVFLFSIKGSSAFQNYAIMSSEIMDLHELSSKDIEGTSFETLGTNFKTGKGGTKTCWRYVCRVEWRPARALPMRQIGHCVNGWNNNRLIRYSKDVTFVEPAVGKTMVDFMSSFDQDY